MEREASRRGYVFMFHGQKKKKFGISSILGSAPKKIMSINYF